MIKWTYNRLTVFLKNLNMKRKLLLSYFVLIVIPLVTLTLLTYNRSSNTVRENMENIAFQALEQSSLSMNGMMANAAKAAELVFLNTDIQEVLTRDLQEYAVAQQLDDAKRIGAYLGNLQNEQEIYRARLYVNDKLLYANENINFFSMGDIQEASWYKQMMGDGSKLHWIYSENHRYPGSDEPQKIISAVKALFNFKGYGQIIAWVSIDMQEKKLQNILQKAVIARNGLMVLVDAEGRVLSSSDSRLLSENYKDIGKYYSLLSKEGEWKTGRVGGKDILISYKTLSYGGWRLFAVLPAEEVLSPSSKLRNYSLLLMLVIGILSYFMAYVISFYMSKRIRKLIKTMAKAESGNMDIKVPVDATDEIGELERNFNKMLDKIAFLIEEKFRVGQEAKLAELRALQAQINPHFLYNTLELINCKAAAYKAKDIRDLVNSLARFYKLSLSKGKDVISIADEIAHIETYVYIQNQRFDGRITLKLDIEEKILDFQIPKLVLQPIVENSILHGIMEKEEKRGIICIKGSFEGECIVLTIQDDGVGMNRETLRTILNGVEGDDVHGYGVKNVNDRLKIAYGEECGLVYQSQPGQGTTVQVRIQPIKNS